MPSNFQILLKGWYQLFYHCQRVKVPVVLYSWKFCQDLIFKILAIQVYILAYDCVRLELFLILSFVEIPCEVI